MVISAGKDESLKKSYETELIAKRLHEELDEGQSKSWMKKASVLRGNSNSQAEEAFRSNSCRSRHAILSAVLAHK